MKHLHAIGISIFLFLTFNTINQAQNINRSAMPYDMVFVGYDNDIGGATSEKIGLLTTVDIQSEYTFGLVNKLKNGSHWVAHNHDELVQISFKIKNGFSFQRGTLIELKLLNGQISIFSGKNNITNQFEIRGLKDPSFQFIKSTGSFLTLHSGYYLSNQNEFLLGTVLDIISIGVARTETTGLQLPRALTPKDIFTTDDSHENGGSIDIRNCNLCDIISIILNPDNWNFVSGTSQDDIDLSDFNLEDCAEVDCSGELLLDVVDCTILMSQNPCESIPASYKWQIKLDGIYITLVAGENEDVVPFVITSEDQDDKQYRLLVECQDGCIYEKETAINCIIDSCEMTLEVDTIGCQLTASVFGCDNPTFNWNYINMGATSQAGNTQSIIAEDNGDYYVIVTGCCEDKVSEYFNMDGCLDCNCTQSLEAINCTILVTEEGCNGYVDTWQYSETGIDTTWQTINYHGTEYETNKNGFYRRVLLKNGCEEISNIIEVNCSEDCTAFNGSAMINSECNIVIDYTGCSSVVSIGISYNSDVPESGCNSASNNNYFIGGGSVLDNNDNGLSGTIVISPEYENTCYQISLTCENGCELFVYAYNPICCMDSLSIEEEDCFAIADGIPCTGVFDYNWIINGTIQSTQTGTSVPPQPILENVTYQLHVVCSDSCEYFSNEILTDCFDPECESSVMIVPEECLMVADIINCPNAIIQWQKWNGSFYEDIPGENEMTYLATEDEPLKVLITNCENCIDEEPLSFEYTPMGCDDMCDCILDVTLDTENCILNSTDTDCYNVGLSLWEQSYNMGNSWFFVAYATSGGSYTPTENGLYRKINYFNDGCEIVYDEQNVECLEDCEPELSVIVTITEDCNLKATWTGCAVYETEGFGWYYTSNSEANCTDNFIYPITSPASGTIIELENNPANQSGYIIFSPEDGAGCYFFNFQCEDCQVIQKTKWWEPCCDDEPEIELYSTDIGVWDYCWLNEGPQEITNIEVELPDGTPFNLSDEPSFEFPYCEVISCGNTIQNLVSDINNWLSANNYLGQAELGPDGNGGCKTNGLFHIEDTEVDFVNGTYIENGSESTDEFLDTYQGIQSDYFLTVNNECEGASYLWSTGETTETIPVDIDFDQGIAVKVTCPDGCVYDSIAFMPQPLIGNDEVKVFSLEDNLSNGQVIGAETNAGAFTIQIYPNPTQSDFTLELANIKAQFIGVKMLNTQGQLVKEKFFKSRDDNQYLIDTETINPGMYFIWIETDEKTIGYKKLIVIK